MASHMSSDLGCLMGGTCYLLLWLLVILKPAWDFIYRGRLASKPGWRSLHSKMSVKSGSLCIIGQEIAPSSDVMFSTGLASHQGCVVSIMPL